MKTIQITITQTIAKIDRFNDHYSVEIVTEADSAEEAKAVAQEYLDVIRRDRLCAIRVYPEGDSYRDFDSKTTTHKGYARFTIVDQPGECVAANLAMEGQIPVLATAKERA